MNTQQLWQAQALDAPRISLAFVRHRSDSLRRWAWMRNAINYVGAFAFLPFFVWMAWSIHRVAPLRSLAILLQIPIGIWLLYRWHERAASQEQPAELGVLDALKFHRRQLERQRDVRLDRWRRWPAIPGILAIFVAGAIEITPTPWVRFGVGLLMMTLVLSIAIVLEERMARRLQKEIDALDSL
jgi:hypothetical protein